VEFFFTLFIAAHSQTRISFFVIWEFFNDSVMVEAGAGAGRGQRNHREPVLLSLAGVTPLVLSLFNIHRLSHFFLLIFRYQNYFCIKEVGKERRYIS
jgi:hypothetical protein